MPVAASLCRMKETTLEANELALRAPNSQNGRLALRAPESRLDEKACIAMLAIAVSRQNLAILVTIPSFGERP